MRTWIVAIVLILILGPVSCTFSAQDIEYQRGEKAEQKKNYAEAVEHYRNVVDKYVKTDTALKAAEKAARISLYELHKYDDALVLYKHTVLYGKNEIERIQAQQKIAEICFSQTMNYTQAVIEFNRLLELPHTPLEGFNYQLSIARSYFYISNFFQAQIEIDSLLKKNYDKSLLFDALLLKANIFLTTKQIDEAIEALKQLISGYPDRSRAEQIGLVLAVCYEEQKNFPKAIEVLESIKDTYPRKEFIQNRIKTLKERASYLPGAKGLKK